LVTKAQPSRSRASQPCRTFPGIDFGQGGVGGFAKVEESERIRNGISFYFSNPIFRRSAVKRGSERRGSNRHGACGLRDFKSLASLNRLHLKIRVVRVLDIFFCRDLYFAAMVAWENRDEDSQSDIARKIEFLVVQVVALFI
jgi:hypothetical protein